MKKIIILVNQLLNKHNCKRFDILNKKKIVHKEFWCLLPITNKKLYDIYKSKDYRIKKNKNFIIIKNNLDLFIKCLSVNKNYYFINWAFKYKYIYFVEILFKLKGAKKIFRFFSDINSGVKLKKNKFKKFVENFSNIFRQKIHFYFVESKANLIQIKKIEKDKSKIIEINSYDYFSFKKININKNKKKYILFIDSNIEKSFESQLLGYKNKIDAFKYWDTMKKIFDFYEKKYKLKVIIASHFRRSLRDKPVKNKFFFDKTPELIKDSKLILCHHSLSILWAVYFRKPITLIFFQDFQNILHINKLYYNFYKNKLGLNKIMVNNKFDINYKLSHNELEINKKKYQKFEKHYLSNPVNNHKKINGWDTISDVVKLD